MNQPIDRRTLVKLGGFGTAGAVAASVLPIATAAAQTAWASTLSSATQVLPEEQ